MATTAEKVKAALEARGVNCGWKAAQMYLAERYPGQPISESVFYRVRKELLDAKQLGAAAFMHQPNKFAAKVNVVPSQGKTMTPAVQKTSLVAKETAPQETEVSTTGPAETNAARDVSFAELMTVAAVVKQIGADKAMRAIKCLHDLQTVLVK